MTKFQFMPSFDANQIYINGSVGVGHTLEQTQEEVKKIEKILLKNVDWKQVSSVTSTVGYKLDGKNKAQMSPINFQIFVNLFESEPKNFFDKFINPILSPAYDDSNMIRTMHSRDIRNKLNDALIPIKNNFTELKVFTQKTGLVKNDIEMALSGDTKLVNHYKEVLKTKLAQIDGVSNISDDILLGDMELKFRVNEYGKELGFSEGYISGILKPLYFQATYSKALKDDKLVDIKIQSINKNDKSSLENLLIPIPSATFSTQKILLSQVVDFVYEPLQSQIKKEDGHRIVTIVATLNKKKVLSEEVYDSLDDTIKEARKNLLLNIKGEQQENKKVKREMSEAFVIAVILIFISLVWMFDSIVKPLIIISTIPLSILGVLLGHFIMGINLTMPGIIGIVGLAGVIVNDGIIVMDFIKNAKTSEELIKLAKLRLRPIVLTSITTVLGLSTLIFFASGQALILQPMAVALGFGILWATFLNLFYVPILYSVIYKK
jgi:multidrug efflux pump subunit AcrB